MAKLLNIITEPNKILRQKSKEINPEKIENMADFFNDMVFTMKEKDGVGLAAPQVGKNIRVITINTKEQPIIMINPIITKKSIFKEWGEEGCLSVPDTFGMVKRHKNLSCSYLDKFGNKKIIEAKGFMARIIQHEIDHLDTILFIDIAKNIKKLEP